MTFTFSLTSLRQFEFPECYSWVVEWVTYISHVSHILFLFSQILNFPDLCTGRYVLPSGKHFYLWFLAKSLLFEVRYINISRSCHCRINFRQVKHIFLWNKFDFIPYPGVCVELEELRFIQRRMRRIILRHTRKLRHTHFNEMPISGPCHR